MCIKENALINKYTLYIKEGCEIPISNNKDNEKIKNAIINFDRNKDDISH